MIMKKFYAILILTIAVLQYCETFAQDEDLATPKEKKEDLKVDTRIDNMRYWMKKGRRRSYPLYSTDTG